MLADLVVSEGSLCAAPDPNEKCQTYAAHDESLARPGLDYLAVLALFVVSSATREAAIWKTLKGPLTISTSLVSVNHKPGVAGR